MEDGGTPDLEHELAHALAATAADRGWRTGGPVTVRVTVDDRARQGTVRMTSDSVPGVIRPWSQLLDAGAGVSHDVGDNRVLIGRDDAADIYLEVPEVSRLHAILFREAGKAWITDLDSANGTFANETPVAERAGVLRPGDTVRFGAATFAFRMR